MLNYQPTVCTVTFKCVSHQLLMFNLVHVSYLNCVCVKCIVAATPLQHASKQTVKAATGSTRVGSPSLLNSHADVQSVTGKGKLCIV